MCLIDEGRVSQQVMQENPLRKTFALEKHFSERLIQNSAKNNSIDRFLYSNYYKMVPNKTYIFACLVRYINIIFMSVERGSKLHRY